MRSPRAPLLWAVGLWAVPLNLLALAYPHRAAAFLSALLPLAAVAIWDWFRAAGRLDGLSPVPGDPVRFTLGKPAVLSLAMRGNLAAPVTVRLLAYLPEQLSPSRGSLETRLQPGEGSWAFPIQVSPVLRGRGSLGGCVLETASPLGFWTLRKRMDFIREVCVYPGLAGRTGKVSLPEIRNNMGQHRRMRTGKGREFEKLREYLHGDDYHDIHWKATAKRGFPVTKTFQTENSQEVYAIVDASRLSSVPLSAALPDAPSADSGLAATRAAPAPIAHAPQPLEYYLRTALRLGMAAERQGDRYGLMAYADRPAHFLPAGKGKSHYGRFRDALCALRSDDASPDYAELFASIRLRLRKRAMLLFLCSLDEPAQAEAFAEHVGLISRQHLVTVVAVKPTGIRPVFQGLPVEADSDVYDRMADHLRLRNLDGLAGRLRRQGVSFRAWEPDRLSAEAVARYLDAKHRRAVA
jgi:uncharacterized protein (DUF58 family)